MLDRKYPTIVHKSPTSSRHVQHTGGGWQQDAKNGISPKIFYVFVPKKKNHEHMDQTSRLPPTNLKSRGAYRRHRVRPYGGI